MFIVLNIVQKQCMVVQLSLVFHPRNIKLVLRVKYAILKAYQLHFWNMITIVKKVLHGSVYDIIMVAFARSLG